MKKLLCLIILSTFCLSGYAEDSLNVGKKMLTIKTNLALIVMNGFGLQAEYVLNKRTGLWGEMTMHSEEHSMFNESLSEKGCLLGVNRYFLFRNSTETHCGTYFGPYLKYRQGYYCGEKETSYSALLAGIQAGIQTVTHRHLVFTFGMGSGIGRVIKKSELKYSSFFERYNLPLLDFRATIAIGYMF